MVMVPKVAIGYNMLIMSYGAYVTDWWCVDDVMSNNSRNNVTYKYCSNDDNSTCSRVYDDYTRTVVTEWDLMCERKWITPIITSIQMAGVLVGAVIAGQSADTFGRKKTFYLTLLLHSILTVAIAFVTSWQAFTVMRCLIGATLGSYLVVSVFPMEFLGFKGRTVLSLIPTFAAGVCLLALVTWWLHDWTYAHIFGGAFTVPFLLGWFVVPESIRWLTVKGKLDKAEKVIEQVAMMNGRAKPVNTKEIIMRICNEERESTMGGKPYSYLDLYRGWKMAKHSIIIQVTWWCTSASLYGFAFGIGQLSGNFYLNLFLMFILEFPIFIPIIYALNKFGRRTVATVMYGAGTISCIAVIIIQNTVPFGYKGVMITTLSLAARLFSAMAWAGIIIITTESYPTVIRNLGYGAANTAARIGGIVAPFIFTPSGNEMVPYIIVIVLLGLSGILTRLFLPETLGLAMEDVVQVDQEGDQEGVQETKDTPTNGHPFKETPDLTNRQSNKGEENKNGRRAPIICLFTENTRL
ncbi:solute carrier family 22 member 16 [Patella vulgata]|uniref:solute carrier family 22 member 16 n=1 Tax=Patella vulgata TaxID=6465 RepID=UPI0024A8304E|nr:solute carrier family 22 member 16 [Patella vulgata]